VPRAQCDVAGRSGEIPGMAGEFIGALYAGWFDYAICDENPPACGDTAEVMPLGTLASFTDRIVGLTGTLLAAMPTTVQHAIPVSSEKDERAGYEWGTSGRSSFIRLRDPRDHHQGGTANNACSKARPPSRCVQPGASPLLFGEFLMQLCAFVFLGDISGELPSYEETYLSVPMDAPMREAYSNWKMRFGKR